MTTTWLIISVISLIAGIHSIIELIKFGKKHDDFKFVFMKASIFTLWGLILGISTFIS